MGFADCVRKMFGQRETVPFLDVENMRVVQIPASELRPGAVQVKIQGSDEVVWALPEQLHPGEIKHPEFDKGIRDYIRQIQTMFLEQRPLSFEEWEDGFRRDTTPEREIARWLHAGEVYTEFTRDEPEADRCRDIYRCIITCLTCAANVFDAKTLEWPKNGPVLGRPS